MKQRKWSADGKLAIVMEGLKEKRSVADICREHKISQTLYYRWRDKFLEGARKGWSMVQVVTMATERR